MSATTEITFEVPGDPVPQPRARVATICGVGRAYTPARHKIHTYRQAIQLVAKTSGWVDGPTDGPVSVEISCHISRPPSHLNSSGELRKAAREWPGRGDVDNYAKAVLDAITDSQAFWLDDDQVVELTTRKNYSKTARTLITVRRQ